MLTFVSIGFRHLFGSTSYLASWRSGRSNRSFQIEKIFGKSFLVVLLLIPDALGATTSFRLHTALTWLMSVVELKVSFFLILSKMWLNIAGDHV